MGHEGVVSLMFRCYTMFLLIFRTHDRPGSAFGRFHLTLAFMINIHKKLLNRLLINQVHKLLHDAAFIGGNHDMFWVTFEFQVVLEHLQDSEILVGFTERGHCLMWVLGLVGCDWVLLSLMCSWRDGQSKGELVFLLLAFLFGLEGVDVGKEVNVSFLFVGLLLLCGVPVRNVLAIRPVTDHKRHLLTIQQTLAIQDLHNLLVLLRPFLTWLLLQTFNIYLPKILIIFIAVKPYV